MWDEEQLRRRSSGDKRSKDQIAMEALGIRLCVHPLKLLLAALCACQALSGGALAADSSEFWPEFSAFIGLRPDMRIYLDASYATTGKESDQASLDASAALDISLKPILRPELQSEDWQRNRYLWARIGYTRVLNLAGGGERSVTENRGVVAVYGRLPLPAGVWLESRTRADLRWIGDDYSTRYRFRLEANREFTIKDHPVVAYFNVEGFYDTRYAGWSRILYQAGAEVTVNERFRYELYLAQAEDRLPQVKSFTALGVVAKFYF
jgi:hypothetical protein